MDAPRGRGDDQTQSELTICEREQDMTTRVATLVGLAAVLLVFPPAGYAQTGTAGVTLHEISERVTFHPRGDGAGGAFVIYRNAISPLFGFAPLGTPLCPSSLMVTAPQANRCTVSAIGWDSVSTVTGTGPVQGIFDVVINAPGNSSVHIPDLPVISGRFSGTVDLSPAILLGVPLGSITGTFTITKVADATGRLVYVTPSPLPFTGTFRLPFATSPTGSAAQSDNTQAAYYLADDRQTLIPVASHQRSMGFPTVRLEVSFSQ